MNDAYIIDRLHEVIIYLERSKADCNRVTSIPPNDRLVPVGIKNSISDALDIVATLYSELRLKRNQPIDIDRSFCTPIAYAGTETGKPGFITEREAWFVRKFRHLSARNQFEAIAQTMNLLDAKQNASDATGQTSVQNTCQILEFKRTRKIT